MSDWLAQHWTAAIALALAGFWKRGGIWDNWRGTPVWSAGGVHLDPQTWVLLRTTLTHVMQDSGVHHFGHLLVQFGHLWRVHILGHVSAWCRKQICWISQSSGPDLYPACPLTFEEAFDAAHLLDHLSKLGVLRQQLLDVSGGHSRPTSYSLDSVWLLTEQLGAVFTVQLWKHVFSIVSRDHEKREARECDGGKGQLTHVTLVIHAVHDGHQLLQSSHRLLFVSFTHKICTEAWNHPLNASQGGGGG